MSENQDDVLRELKKSNELLAELLQVQRDVQSRQRRFWVAAMVQLAILLAVSAWWWARYGY